MTIEFGSLNIADNVYAVSLGSEEIGSKVYVNGREVPNGRFWEAYLDNDGDTEALCKIAVESAVYGVDTHTTIVVTDKPVRDGDFIIDTGEGWSAVKRTEFMRSRPFMRGTMCRFELEPKEDMLTGVCIYMQHHGRVPVGYVDRKLFFVREEQVEATLAEFGLSPDIVDKNVHLSTRVAVLMKRPGTVCLNINTPDRTFNEKDNDGTVVITRDVDEAFPGTLRVSSPDGNLFYKGMVRPPLVNPEGDRRETPCICADAQLGKKLDPAVVGNIEFYPVRTLPGEFASVNYQAVMFGHKDPASYIREDTKRNFEEKSVLDILTPEDRKKVEAGVPPAMLIGQYAPWSWVTKFVPEKAARATVYGSYLVDNPTGVKLLEKTWRRIGCPKPGTYVTLHRDPAVPDGSSTASYRYEGLLHWESGVDVDGIALHPLSDSWKAAGGDFDGDAAVIFRGQVGDWTVHHAREHDPLKTDTKYQGVRYADGSVAWASTVMGTISGFANLLGSAVNLAMRLRELGPLDGEVASHAQCVIQGSVDAKKHPVDARRGNSMYADLKDTVDLLAPEDGFLLDRLQVLRKAGGFDQKVEAWGMLVDYAKEVTGKSVIVTAMCERIVAIDRLFGQTNWLRGSRVGLPGDMRKTARAEVMRMESGRNQIRLVTNLSNIYRGLIREANDTRLSEVERQMRRDRAYEVRNSIRTAVHLGELHPWALVGYSPHRMAAQLVSADDFAALNKSIRYVECGMVYGNCHDFEADEYTEADPQAVLEHLVDQDKGRVGALLEHVASVSMKVLKRYDRSVRVALAW